MENLMTVKMGRGEFLRAALLLAGGTLLDLSFPKGRVHAAETPQARKAGKAMEKEQIKIYSAAQEGYVMTEKSSRRKRSGGVD